MRYRAQQRIGKRRLVFQLIHQIRLGGGFHIGIGHVINPIENTQNAASVAASEMKVRDCTSVCYCEESLCHSVI